MRKTIEEFNGVAWIRGTRLICDQCGEEAERLYIDKDDERELCAACTLNTHEIIV